MSKASFVSQFYEFANKKLDDVGRQILVPTLLPSDNERLATLFCAYKKAIFVININNTFILRLWYPCAHDAVEQDREKIMGKAEGKKWGKLSVPNGRGASGKSRTNVVDWDLKNDDMPQLTSWQSLIDNKETIFNRILDFYCFLREVGIDFKTKNTQGARNTAPKSKNEKKQKSKEDKTPWIPSERAQNYHIDVTRRYHLNKELGDIIDDSYLGKEEKIIDCYNKLVKKVANRIYPCAFFELGLQGNIENALFLCGNLNSGFCDNKSPSDIDAFEDEKLRKIIFDIREAKKHNNAPEPHIALLNAARKLQNGNYPFVNWFRDICSGSAFGGKQWVLDIIKNLIGNDKNDDEVFDWLAYHFATRELVFYHTKEAGNIVSLWQKAYKESEKIKGKGIFLSPHQKVVIDDMKRAMELRIPIILRSQSTWFKYVEGLQDYNLLFCSASRRIYLSSGNLLLCKGKKNYTSAEAHKEAWKKFTEAIMERYKKIPSK